MTPAHISARQKHSTLSNTGDGTPLTERQGAALLDIQRFQMEQRTVFKWRVGDILIIDNRLVMHSRNPFKNDKSRRILAAIGGAPLYLQEREERDEQHMLTLRSGDRMPSLGYGVWKVQKDATANSVYVVIFALCIVETIHSFQLFLLPNTDTKHSVQDIVTLMLLVITVTKRKSVRVLHVHSERDG